MNSNRSTDPKAPRRPRSATERFGLADKFVVPFLEAGLLVVVGGFAMLSRMPLLFASLGPTAYEQVEMPNMRSAHLYSVIAGHLVALGSGLFALWATGAAAAPTAATRLLSGSQLGSAALALFLTVGINLFLKASQPAACSTALLVGLGTYHQPGQLISIAIGVLLLAALGEPLRRYRLRKMLSHLQQSPGLPSS